MTLKSKSIIVHGILIAAGASRRLGQAKQLVMYQGKYLINHTSDVLKDTGLDKLKIVLGCNSDMIRPLMNAEADVLINDNWHAGMGSSISCGVNSLDDDVDGVLISLVDQYHTTSELIDLLIKEFRKDDNKLIISRYGNGIDGPPAIFPRRLLNQLRYLQGDKGAGKIIKAELTQNPNEVVVVPFEQGHFDIDTPEDLLNLAE